MTTTPAQINAINRAFWNQCDFIYAAAYREALEEAERKRRQQFRDWGSQRGKANELRDESIRAARAARVNPKDIARDASIFGPLPASDDAGMAEIEARMRTVYRVSKTP